MKKPAHKYSIGLFLCIFISTTSISAQQLTPSVISASGGFYSNTSGMLSFTTGEMSAVETFISSGNILTQGFQQPLELGTAVPRVPEAYFSFDVYPNPSDGKFNVVMQSAQVEKMKIALFDIHGREMMNKTLIVDNTKILYPFDVSNLIPGSYLIILTPQDHPTAISMIKKIQIIR